MAMTIGLSLPVPARVWPRAVRFRNDGAAARLTIARLDDFKKNLRVTAIILSPNLVPIFSSWFLVFRLLASGIQPETRNQEPETSSSLKLRRAEHQAVYFGDLLLVG